MQTLPRNLLRPAVVSGALVSVLLGLCLPTPAEAQPADATPPRERTLLDRDWRFAFGHPFDPTKDFNFGTGYFSYVAKAGYGDGPAAPGFDDRAWRLLDLPHDWAVEQAFSSKGNASHGYRAVGRTSPETSVGWYRKTFAVPASDLGRRISVEFEGVYRDSIVWVNGFLLGRQASGYSSFGYDMTDYLNYGGKNEVVVRVDATFEEGWFYEGAGIYRNVWLVKTGPLHVPTWGTFVTTQVEGGSATVNAATTVKNDGTLPATFEILQEITGPGGQHVASASVPGLTLEAGASGEFPCALTVAHPSLWSLDAPALHTLVTTLRSNGAVIDRYTTPFGIRTVEFTPDKGFFLNGRRVEIQGTNDHQDFAGVGVAVPDSVQYFRIARLKAMGSNAIRTSHNPPSPGFLDACDRLGMLVLDENRLMGSNPAELDGLSRMIRRDRNHPSVVIWSLGNEEWAIEGNIKGARIASTMQAYAKRLDPTRRATVANSGGWGGISTVIDVVGYNYIHQVHPDKQHADYPLQPGVGTEETTTQCTRGIYITDKATAHLAPLQHGDSGGNCEEGWQFYAARPFLSGLFFWTGFDYRGEPTPFEWPAISSQFGLVDTCGFPKDNFYYLKSWWSQEPVLHIFPHWNWPGREGKTISVGCFSNYDAVELKLNGRSLGRKDMPRNGHLDWEVTYEPGKLEAVGFRAGAAAETIAVETTGAPAALELSADKASLAADGADASVVAVRILDASGRTVPTADNLVTFELKGPGRIIGVANGDPSSHEKDRFAESVATLFVTDWRGRIAPDGTADPANPDSLPPLTALGNWKAPRPQGGERYDLTATFTVTEIPETTRFHLYLPSLGQRTTLWLNGHELAKDVDTSEAGPDIALDRGVLVAGLNRIQLIAVPFADGKNHIPDRTRLGAVQAFRPADPWERHAFNGLAEVIVQASGEPGEITLKARSAGLETKPLILAANPAP
jgi:beta-galactosidase